MKAWIIDGKFGLDALRLAERETPRPRAGEVLVRVRAASLNYRDLGVVEGFYFPDQPLPLTPGSDAAGEVVAVGEGVTRVRAGDRVALAFYQGAWIGGGPDRAALGTRTLGGPRQGVLAEYAIADAEGVVRYPEHLTFGEASTLPIAGVTAWQALFTEAQVGPGSVVVVQGTGGVAAFAIQLARAAGARVLVTSRSAAKLERARALGAHEAIDTSATPAWDERVLALTEGTGADVVVDVAGGDLRRSVNALRFGGQVSLVGLLGGTTAQLEVVPVIQRRARIQAISVGSREMFEALDRLVGLHRLRPAIARTYPFERADEALAALRAGEHVGKIVVDGATT
ncbi:NAD(P)-dependent alcohol dehydrogenase [Anaeromyxobacter sp. PSR-1]|uniref:zinc-dependent alcohol dehydrogenase family protein n=1 Tax=Anaeromyxobacter sp. PSR-1 TaxID=1300915 RepID=UPI0005E1235B|nr:NAD(P)-dependent alcohol dehydrogenase [Anaeromyxobacter sp. PSR-1]GAO04741.1 Zinc-type alcohol dehydrogenase-like protein C1773.06c [Anaeromyxobacter sp. PSR-1]